MGYQFEIALSFAVEDQDLVEKVYHYLKAENINIFYAPSPEGQILLSGKNQREIFYNIFGINTEYVALFVSKHYINKEIPMEEASIAFAKHGNDGKVIPIYLDGTSLPASMFDPKNTNYFKSDNPAVIASHLAAKINSSHTSKPQSKSERADSVMNISGNIAEKQFFIHTSEGSINL